MKHKTIPSALFRETEKAILSGVFKISNFPIELISLVVSKEAPKNVVIVVSSDVFWHVYESTPFNGGRMYAVPPKKGASPANGFISLSDRLLLQTKSLDPEALHGNIVICSKCSLETPLFSKKLVKKTFNSSCNRDSLTGFLFSQKYNPVEFVKEVGEYAIRGSIVDVFPLNLTNPVRFNFFDSVDIFSFDIETQNIVNSLEAVNIVSVDLGGAVSVLDYFIGSVFYFFKDNSLIPFSDIVSNCMFKTISLSYESFVRSKTSSKNYFIFDNVSLFGFVNDSVTYIPRWYVDKKNSVVSEPSLSTSDWEKGDFLVHRDFGVCKYLGLGLSPSTSQEVALLEFDGGKVRLSVDRFDLITFLSKSSSTNQKLSSLNKPGLWKRTFSISKKIASDYVNSVFNNLYKRKGVDGCVLKIDKKLEHEFIEDFKHVDTDGQKNSWSEIKKDLAKSWPMYRLLCGDVGFGKTEVAIRASFITTLSGFSTLVMAPTNILAQQLYESFCKRLNGYGISVAFLSKNNSKDKNMKLLKEFQTGAKQIIISTHKLLFIKDLYKNVGLVVIDEEHRFGVKQKELLKNLYPSANFLLMTATPIPRSLYLGFNKIQDMSIIDTPPISRRRIITQSVVQETSQFVPIIKHELARNGQVYIVYNSVVDIEPFTNKVLSFCPFAGVDFIHGSLPATRINTTMRKFRNKEIDVLISSSIIESGVDIPNVNTIIIYNSHRFGLSQLYQLRGRVGRGNVQAYCYLSIPNETRLSSEASERLRTIITNSSLGSNYEIAKADLEIRGPGTVFGYKQSGGLSRVGLDLYSQLVLESLSRLEAGEGFLSPSSVSISIGEEFNIPENYIYSLPIRTSVYKKIHKITSVKDAHKLKKHLLYRFGPPPKPVTNLIENQMLKNHCSRVGIYKITLINDKLSVFFVSLNKGFLKTIIQLATTIFSDSVSAIKGEKLGVVINVKTNIDIPSKIGVFLDKLQHDKINP